MERDIISKSPKFSVQIKQSAKGKYYLGSFKVNAESKNELEDLLDTMLPRVIGRIKKLNSPKKKKKSKKNKIVLTDEDKAIYEKLKSLRNKIARDKDIPAYLVFQNDTLKRIALSKPANKEMMLNIKGVGEKNFKSYGKQFIDYLQILLEGSS